MEEKTPIQVAVDKAKAVWKDIKTTMKKEPLVKVMSESDRISYFYKIYSDFYQRFPIVARYMVSLGQFSSVAFDRYLRYCDMHIDKGLKKESIWLDQQATYVKFLYQAYHPHCSVKELDGVYDEAMSSLKSEFNDFQDKIRGAKMAFKEREGQCQVSRFRNLEKEMILESDKVSVDDLLALKKSIEDFKSLRQALN